MIHYKRFTGSDGIAQVWMNGKLVVDYKGVASYTNYEVGTYKKGIYISGPVSNRKEYVLYVDDSRVWQGGPSPGRCASQ